MTELKKIELTEEALDQVSGGKITAKQVAIAGAALLLVLISGGVGYVLYKHKKDKKSTSNDNQGTELQNLSKQTDSQTTPSSNDNITDYSYGDYF